ncbi:hypothetical protein CTAYLR_009759 [Chrysophaeum taylorii]|uniref:Uncharacterized protein n=1 Tax=Chrysophaeum taylorii TaxID=2483200 RepID=A0AAD7XSV5_9STRA|nr:hypothetical protein CTAYLR_009759 [Chrysophaeum taylorii]
MASSDCRSLGIADKCAHGTAYEFTIVEPHECAISRTASGADSLAKLGAVASSDFQPLRIADKIADQRAHGNAYEFTVVEPHECIISSTASGVDGLAKLGAVASSDCQSLDSDCQSLKSAKQHAHGAAYECSFGRPNDCAVSWTASGADSHFKFGAIASSNCQPL